MIKQWLIRVILGLLGVLIIFHGVLFFVFNESAIKDRVVSYIFEKLNAECSIESAALNHFPDISIRLKDVVIRPQQGTAFSVQSVRADLALFPLLWGETKITHLYLERPQFAIETDSTGKISICGLTLSSDETDYPDYKGQLDIRSAEIAFHPALGTQYLVEECDADLEISLSKGMTSTLQGGIKLHNCKAWEHDEDHPLFQELDFAFQGLIGISQDQSELSVTDSKIWLGKAELQISGNAVDRLSNSPVVDFQITGTDVDLFEMTKVLPKSIFAEKDELTIGGNADIDIRISSEKSSARSSMEQYLNGKIILKNATMAIEGSNTNLKKINGTFNVTDKGISFTGINGETDSGRFQLDGMYSPHNQHSVEISLKGNIEIGVLSRLLGLPSDWKIVGSCLMDGTLKGSFDKPESFVVIGSLQPLNARITTPYLEKPFSSITGQVSFTGNGANADLIAALEAGDIHLTGDMQNWINPTFNLKVESNSLDLDKAIPKSYQAADKALPAVQEMQLALKGELQCASFKLFGIKLTDLNSSFQLDDGLFKLNALSAHGYGGSINLKGSVQFTEQLPKFTINARIRNVNVGDYLTDETSLKQVVTGKLNADVQFTAFGTEEIDIKKSLIANGKATLTNGRIKGLVTLDKFAEYSGLEVYKNLQFLTVNTDFDIKEGFITIGRFELTGQVLDMKLTGALGLNYSLKFDSEQQFSKSYTEGIVGTKRTTKVVKDSKGNGYLAVHVDGMADDPSFLLDAELMGKMLGKGSNPTIEANNKTKTKPEGEVTPTNPEGWFK